MYPGYLGSKVQQVSRTVDVVLTNGEKTEACYYFNSKEWVGNSNKAVDVYAWYDDNRDLYEVPHSLPCIKSNPNQREKILGISKLVIVKIFGFTDWFTGYYVHGSSCWRVSGFSDNPRVVEWANFPVNSVKVPEHLQVGWDNE